MKQLFHIKNRSGGGDEQVLSLRLGEKHAGFAITDKSGNDLQQLFYCVTDDPDAIGWNEKGLAHFFTSYPVLSNSFFRVQVAYDFSRSISISPKHYKQQEGEFLLNSQGFNSGCSTIITESIADIQLTNIYAVPKEIHEWVSNKFPGAKCRHQYTVDIKNLMAAGVAGKMTVDFRKDDFTVVMAKDSKFLLAQTFDYSTPADILYYLLKICQQFSLSQQELQLRLSGLIDKQSSLYNELYNYFINVEFREATWSESNEYPAHFFTSLNDLAKCEL